MVNEETIITGKTTPNLNVEETSNINTEETPTGVKTTQDTAGEKLKKTLDTTMFTNPLLQNITTEDLTQQNFPRYQKDIENILWKLLGQIMLTEGKFSPENIIKENRIEDNLSEAKKQCKFLEEYCHILGDEKILLPYKYLGSIAHALKPVAETIEAYIYSRKTQPDNKQKRLESGKKSISSIINSIQGKIEKIEKIDFTESNLYTKKIFSPFEASQKIINTYAGEIEKKHIQLKNDLPEDLSIESYQDIFELTIENLITNAIKFTPDGGTISIEVKDEYNKTIRFSIEDTGVGIPSDTDVFARGYTTPSLEGKQGTGLGLADVKLFMEMMGGSIEYKDNTPHGTIFTFSMKKTPSQKDLQK